MDKKILNEVLDAYKISEDTLSKKTTEELLLRHLVSIGLKKSQAKEIIKDMNASARVNVKENKDYKKEKVAEVEHGTSCPRLVMKESKKLIAEY